MNDTPIRLLSLSRRLTSLARELRLLSQDLSRESSTRGALGSRGLTQFILEHLEFAYPRRFTVAELRRISRAAGYATPDSAALTQRLSEYRARTGKVDSVRGQGWAWVQPADEKDSAGEPTSPIPPRTT